MNELYISTGSIDIGNDRFSVDAVVSNGSNGDIVSVEFTFEKENTKYRTSKDVMSDPVAWAIVERAIGIEFYNS